MNNDEQNGSAFELRARELLRDSVDNLDAATRSRLTQARHAALAASNARPIWLDLRVLAPGGAAAAVVLAAILLWGAPGHHPTKEAGSALDDLELLADSDGYELSQEPDLDFIEWAASRGETDPVGT
jgi:hypothetical protein